jgi:hypothetical protein
MGRPRPVTWYKAPAKGDLNMQTPKEVTYKDKRAWLIAALKKGIEEANQLDIDEPLLVIPKDWDDIESEEE